MGRQLHGMAKSQGKEGHSCLLPYSLVRLADSMETVHTYTPTKARLKRGVREESEGPRVSETQARSMHTGMGRGGRGGKLVLVVADSEAEEGGGDDGGEEEDDADAEHHAEGGGGQAQLLARPAHPFNSHK